jgi:predicted enzyme related to lactoylglutathione lyase
MKLHAYSVAVVVADRKKAKKWYTKTLGLKVLSDEGHWTVVGSKKGKMALHLCQVTEFDPKGKLEPGNTGVLFTVDGSIEKMYKSLKKKGVNFTVPPKKEEWGWFASFTDPDGNEFMLMPG